MTTAEMVDELSKSLGNRTDITDARYVRWLNWGLYDLCGFHQKRLFPPKRFHVLQDYVLFQTIVNSNLCGASISTVTFQVTGTDAVAALDYYNDMIVELTAYTGTAPAGLLNQKRVIVDYAGAAGGHVCTIDRAWDVNPDTNTTYCIYRRRYDINADMGVSPQSVLQAVERIEAVEDGAPIDQKGWKEIVNVDITNTGAAGEFARRGNGIYFIPTPDEAKWYRAYYYRLPSSLSANDLTATCELPEDWHEIVILGGVWRGFEKLMEPARSAEAKGRYQSAARDKRDAFEMEDGHIRRGLKVRMS